jgi:hypothetical protein
MRIAFMALAAGETVDTDENVGDVKMTEPNIWIYKNQ